MIHLSSGQKPQDIDQAWVRLEKQENLTEAALKEELLRHEKLEQLANKFEIKSALKEGYLNEMIAILSNPSYWPIPSYWSNLQEVGASVEKHKAISANILARVEGFRELTAMSNQLQQERYWREEEIKNREKAIMERWEYLNKLLDVHKDKMEQCCTIMTYQRELETSASTILALQRELDTSEQSCNKMDAQEKLQKFQLQESQVHKFKVKLRYCSKYHLTSR